MYNRLDWIYSYDRSNKNIIITEGKDPLGKAMGTDIIQFKDINPSDVTVSRNGNDIILTIKSNNNEPDGSITIKDAFGYYYGQGIEKIYFSDQTIWTRDTLIQKLSLIPATSGDDIITRGGLEDTIQGGKGDDIIYDEGYSNDKYIYSRGDGNDIITDIDGLNDQLVFTDINAPDVILDRSGDDVIVKIKATATQPAGSVTLKNTQDPIKHTSRGVDSVVFANGTNWTMAEMQMKLLAQASTAGNDIVNGFANSNDTIRGGKGNDQLAGNTGNDTYIYARGDGHDTIIEVPYVRAPQEFGYGSQYERYDALVFTDINATDVTVQRNGNDVILLIKASASGPAGSVTLKNNIESSGSNGVETIKFADGTVWTESDVRAKLLAPTMTAGNDTVNGFNSSDLITGGKGNDVLKGGGGDDTYVYARGDGNDVIHEWSTRTPNGGGNDSLVFTDINAKDVTIRRSGNDVTLNVKASTSGPAGSILLKDSLDDSGTNYQGVETVIFADGSKWTQADLRVQVLAQASTTGNDTITGFGTNDIITGGKGNDMLMGATGDDTYVYSRGDGRDIVVEKASENYSTNGYVRRDTLLFSNVNASDITLQRYGNDLMLHVKDNGSGTAGSVLLKNTLDGVADEGVETVQFADGTSWTKDDMRARLLAQAATNGNDHIVGFSSDDILTGGFGNDTLDGAGGNDTLYGDAGNDSIIGGAGNDTLYGDIGNDYLYGSAGDDILIGGAGNDGLFGEVGNDSLYGSAGDDYLNGAAGNDGLFGEVGNDTLYGEAGDDYLNGGAGHDGLYGGIGQDTLDGAEGNDWLNAGAGNDLLIGGIGDDTLDGAEDNDLLDGGTGHDILTGGTGDDTLDGDEDNDTLYAGAGNDILIGGTGNDMLAGGAGADTFVFSKDFGTDTITDFSAGQGLNDMIQMSKTLFDSFAAVIANAHQSGSDTVISYGNYHDTLTLKNVKLETLHADDFSFV